MESTDIQDAYNINKSVSFVPKQEDPLDVAIYILDENIEHKKNYRSLCSPTSSN